MNKMTVKELAATLVACMGIISSPSLLIGQEATTHEKETHNAAPTTAATDECSIELLRSFFPEKFVSATLEKFNVPEDKRAAIIKELSTRDRQVLKIVEEKASKLTPNPFKDRDPRQRQVGVKLFRDTLLQIMTEVFNENGITDQKQIQDMLDNINQEKAKNFRDCIEKQKLNLPGLKSEDKKTSQNEDNSDDNEKGA